MEAKVKTDVSVVLTLTECEARWLRGMMQNPINTTYEEENQFDSDMRKLFFDELTNKMPPLTPFEPLPHISRSESWTKKL